jgi:hypothetical protein
MSLRDESDIGGRGRGYDQESETRRIASETDAPVSVDELLLKDALLEAIFSLIRCASHRSGASPASGPFPHRLRWWPFHRARVAEPGRRAGLRSGSSVSGKAHSLRLEVWSDGQVHIQMPPHDHQQPTCGTLFAMLPARGVRLSDEARSTDRARGCSGHQRRRGCVRGPERHR